MEHRRSALPAGAGWCSLVERSDGIAAALYNEGGSAACIEARLERKGSKGKGRAVSSRWKAQLGSAVILVTLLGIVLASIAVEDLHLMPRPATARRVLVAFGYSQIRITGVHPLGCADGEPFRTGFEAISIAGKRVRGTVCQGWFQGAVIRLD